MANEGRAAGILDVAIVGGGIGGIYAGWRLAESGRSNVAVFESSGRTGGRLLSLIPPDLPSARVEVGGMRYISSHVQVMGLVEYLGLERENFIVGCPKNIAYVRGRRLHTEDLGDATKIPYNLSPADLDCLQNGVPAFAAEKFLQEVLHEKHVDLSKVDWLEVANTGEFEGHKLTDLSMHYILSRMVGHEAFQYAYDTSGYDSIFYTWNSADGFPWNLGDFGATVEYYHLTQGYQQVVLEVQKRFETSGGVVHLKHPLVKFDVITLDDESNAVQMEFAAGENGRHVTVIARHLVLALPRRAIELLSPTGVVLDPENKPVRDLIESVTPVPLFKLALAYRTRWWESGDPALGITQGQSVTDLPIRQCYYWNVEDANTDHGVILVYDDGQDLEYWASLRSLKYNDAFTNSGTPAENTGGLSNWNDFPAPRLMVEEAHRQLLEIHGIESRPEYEPYAAAYMDWGRDPYGGGANFWPLHVKSHDVARDILQPMSGVPVYICGEAYSHQQGWVEGALATTESMLQKHLGLAPPAAPLVSPGAPI